MLELILKKSIKSLQIKLNEWSESLDYSLTASAYSQARKKFRHTAFIELLQKCVVDVMYQDDDHICYKGHRLLAIDGSTLRLPNSEDCREEFGVVSYAKVSPVEGKASILYDTLNNIPIHAELFKGRTSDLVCAPHHLEYITEEDIILADRGYDSYRFFAAILAKNANFIIRTKDANRVKEHELTPRSRHRERIVELKKPGTFQKDQSLPESIKLRFIRVDLGGGKTEILITSLIDKKKYPHKHFKVLYAKRWGVETYYNILKSRLSIDNFSGKTVESVRQDFHSTIFVSGLETILTEEANERLKEKNTKHPQQVNKAISFHVIKQKVIAMMILEPEDFEEEMIQLFMQNPTLVRPDRESPPRNIQKGYNHHRRSLHHQRYVRKHVY